MSAESLPLPLVSLLLVWTCFCVLVFSFSISSAASGTFGRWSPERSGCAQECKEGLTTVIGKCRVPSPAQKQILGKCFPLEENVIDSVLSFL